MKENNLFRNKISGTVIAIFVCALWGSLFPCIKLGYSAFKINTSDIPSIILFAGIRFLICGAALIAMASIKQNRVSLPKKNSFAPIIAIGMTSIVLHYTFTYIGLSMTEGSKTSILKQVGFLFITCFAFLFRKEDKFSVTKLLGGMLGFISIIAVNLDGLEFSFGIGDFLILGASVCSVASNIISKNAFDRLDPVHTIAYAQFLGGVTLTLTGIVMGGKVPLVTPKAILILVYICFASVTGYALWNILVKYNDLSRMSILKFFEPLFGVVFSGILLGENILRLKYFISFLLIASAVLIINMPKKNRK